MENEDRSKTHITINLEEVLQDRNHKDNVLIKEYDIVGGDILEFLAMVEETWWGADWGFKLKGKT